MKFFLIFILSLPAFAQDPHEYKDSGKADLFATGVFSEKMILSLANWPVKVLSIGHLMQQYQNYGGSAYWHDGLDIRTNANEPILAARGGKVVNIENYQPGNAFYWEVAILDDDGFVWKYHHVKESTIPSNIKKAYETGEHISDGAHIGDVIPWSNSSFGEVYHHVHMLIVDKDHNYINPLRLLTALADTTPPIIKSIILAENGNLKPNTTKVSAKHQIYIDTFDVLMHPLFILPPHEISFSLDNEAEVKTWTFNTLITTNDEDFIEDFYHPESCGNYRCRKFYINVGFTKDNPSGDFVLKSGTHTIKVKVKDFIGNKTESELTYTVN